METIEGTVETISRAYNGGWRIARVHPHGTVTGVLPNLEPGDVCIFQGRWKEHPRYGKQFDAKHAHVDTPRDIQGIRHYLARHFSWIGPQIARKLLERFGETLFTVMEGYPDRLAEVPGITPERAREIHETFLSIKGDQECDVFFSTHGITLNMLAKLVGQYGSKQKAIERIKENPYRLARDVWGVGFKRADEIALSLGIKTNSPYRLEAGLMWTLREASGEGHCFLPKEEFLKRAAKALGVNRNGDLAEALEDLVEKETVMEGPADRLYQTRLWDAERDTAICLRRLLNIPHARMMNELSPEILEDMDPDQRRALELALSSRVSIITGGPGTGKTWTINRIIQALGYREGQIELAAPTGKAAKRMTEATGRPARTLHRLLGYNPSEDSWFHHCDNPLECKALIVDETSMIDIELMAILVDAIDPGGTQVIFVGDVDQLPSVGPGRVLADMIESGVVPTARLQTLHRQAAESLINRNAQRINAGESLVLDGSAPDFAYFEADDADHIRELLPGIVAKVHDRLGYAYSDVQVLCPQKKGKIGAHELNDALRGLLNPGSARIAESFYQRGDRVIQLRNNYDLRVFNGEIGSVLGDHQEREGTKNLVIEFDEREVLYPKAAQDELALAYALTVHKSQGSEFPVVVIPVHTTNYMMLKRNLLYTAITRGKRLVVLVGSMKAISLAIRTLDSHERYSGLKERLKRS